MTLDKRPTELLEISPEDDTHYADISTTNTIPAPALDPFLGILIDGRYLLLERLGEGGMGCVYRANHVLMDKHVAIKLIHSELAHMEAVAKRNERAARSTSRLTSPHCISVTDFGRMPRGELYLVMELLEGEELSKRLQRLGRLPVAEALRLTAQILKGLAHAHQQGVIHRDLKPENIFLITHGDEKDFVKILDFGIAKLASESGGDNLTRSGMVFGTPRYLSPEQALGDTVDHRADLYAVGVILYEMLTGTAPYEADTAMEIMSMHLSAPLPSLSRHGKFPVGLQQVVHRAMRKQVDERYVDAAAFLHDIEHIDLAAMPESSHLLKRVRTAVVAVHHNVRHHPKTRRLQTRLHRLTNTARHAGQRHGRRLWQWIMSTRRNQIITGSALLLSLLLCVMVGRCAATDDATNGDVPEVFSATAPLPVTPAPTASSKVDDANEKAKEIRAILSKAEGELNAGQIDEAIATIKQVQPIDPKSAPAKFLLGHAHFANADHSVAMFNYEEALKIDPSLAEDATLRANLQAALERSEGRDKAALLYAKYGGAKALESLATLCNSALTHGGIRRAARQALIATEQQARIDWIATLTADFHENKECKHRKQVIAEMRKTGLEGFIPLLQEYAPKALGGKRTARRNPHACIGKDVKEALEALRSGAPDSEGAPE